MDEKDDKKRYRDMDIIEKQKTILKDLKLRAKVEKENKLKRQILIRDLPMVYGLFSVGISSGMPILNVMCKIARYCPESCKEDINNVIKEIDAGRSLQNSLINLENNPQFRIFAHVISESCDCGTDVLPTLDSLHKDSMNKIRREAESAIKKLPISMLFPLVICILPAFMLLSVIPTLANGIFNTGI